MDTEIIRIQNILLAEDDPHDAELALTALTELNLAKNVTVVGDGAEALDYLYCRGKYKTRAGGNPLLDNKMPKVSGLEVLKTVKADAQLQAIPVVALTSSREPSDLAQFYKHGVNAYVVKPVSFAEFVKVLKLLGDFWGTVNEVPPQTNGEKHRQGLKIKD